LPRPLNRHARETFRRINRVGNTPNDPANAQNNRRDMRTIGARRVRINQSNAQNNQGNMQNNNNRPPSVNNSAAAISQSPREPAANAGNTPSNSETLLLTPAMFPATRVMPRQPCNPRSQRSSAFVRVRLTPAGPINVDPAGRSETGSTTGTASPKAGPGAPESRAKAGSGATKIQQRNAEDLEDSKSSRNSSNNSSNSSKNTARSNRNYSKKQQQETPEAAR